MLNSLWYDRKLSTILDVFCRTDGLRHRTNKKPFALIYERNGKLCVNLKYSPFETDFLGKAFEGVTQGYHMNYEHWNTVTIGSDMSDEELKYQIRDRYDLIKPKVRNK